MYSTPVIKLFLAHCRKAVCQVGLEGSISTRKYQEPGITDGLSKSVKANEFMHRLL